jgi:hypothetical protein
MLPMPGNISITLFNGPIYTIVMYTRVSVFKAKKKETGVLREGMRAYLEDIGELFVHVPQSEDTLRQSLVEFGLAVERHRLLDCVNQARHVSHTCLSGKRTEIGDG